MHLEEREKLMNAVYTCPKLQKLTYFLLKKKDRVGPYTTVKDFCDKVWDNITGKNNQYMRVDVVSDNYKSPHLLKK